jgi:hypothetical protein
MTTTRALYHPVLSVLALAFSTASTVDSEISMETERMENEAGAMIVGGEPVDPGEYPYFGEQLPTRHVNSVRVEQNNGHGSTSSPCAYCNKGTLIAGG